MIYVLLADGFEETEALEPVDIMRRAGLKVQTVGIAGKTVTGSHGITVVADIEIDDVKPEDTEVLVLPGGPGHEKLDASNDVHYLINNAHSNGKYIAAICAAPSIIGKKGLLSEKSATCFPGYEDMLYGAKITGEKAVVDGKFITARGAGAAAEFGFAIVSELCGSKTAEELRRSMQY
jgi:4-methyl-5(b-hydroxyethyl)-thiazole monophosphate biosynthesis